MATDDSRPLGGMGAFPPIAPGSTNDQVEPGMVARAAGGDTEAFQHLVEEHKDWLYRYLFRMMGNREEAEDLVQECFLRAWKGLDRFEQGRPLRPWLLRIASNLAHSALRKPRKVTITIDGPDVPEPADPATGSSAQQARHDLTAIRAIVAGLPPSDRELFHLRYHEGFGPGEIGALVGKSSGAISTALHRLREKIKQGLDQTSGKEHGPHEK
ncbi:MAG: RNA polymerase sigma factor [Candidatus Sumerlaeia bacterium]|nr:RNA polymerase sigma factor [Candidatus Sumerlaeia bacterium]